MTAPAPPGPARATDQNASIAFDAWSFVAMEYYALLLNRVFVIALRGERLEARQCRGLTGAVDGHGALTRALTRRMAVHGDLDDPSVYIDARMERRPWLRWRNADFSVPLAQIESVVHDPRRKWGMGYYPHDGRIHLRTAVRSRELIVLGQQSGRAICARIRAAAGLV